MRDARVLAASNFLVLVDDLVADKGLPDDDDELELDTDVR